MVKILLLFFIWTLIGLNTYSPDYASYEAVYNGTYYGLNIDVGFKACCDFFSSLGLSYQQFRMVWSFLYVILLNNFVTRNTKSPNLALSLMLICPVLLDVSGIRSCVAYLIALNFAVLLKNPTLKNKIVYTVGVLLAATIHVTAVFYLIFLLIGVQFNKKKIIFILFGITTASVIVYSPLLGKIASTLYSVTGIYAIQKWLLGGNPNTHPNLNGILSVAIFLLAYVWILLKEYNLYHIRVKSVNNYDTASQHHNQKDIEYERTVSFLKSVGVFMLFLLPLIMISTESRRLLFGVMVVFYCMTGNVFTNRDRSLVYTSLTLWLTLAEIFISIGVLWMYMYSYQSHDVMAALRDNIVLGLGR